MEENKPLLGKKYETHENIKQKVHLLASSQYTVQEDRRFLVERNFLGTLPNRLAFYSFSE
jgi:hypothetical protein